MLQRVVAVDLGIDLARVRVTRGGTDVVPFDPGVGGSRTTHIVGGAALDAARQLRGELEAACRCELAGRPEGAMHLRDGGVRRPDGTARIAGTRRRRRWSQRAAANPDRYRNVQRRPPARSTRSTSTSTATRRR